MSALALPKRKASKDPVEDPIEDPDEDDPDFDPENPEECYDIKVVFSNKYKTPFKKTKNLYRCVLFTYQEILHRIFYR